MKQIILIIVLLVPVVIGQGTTPRAIAKFCVNQVVHRDQIEKAEHANNKLGCQRLILTRINGQYFHAYGVEVFIGE